MTISLIIPVFNEEKYIKKCLESLCQQIKKPEEIIIVDNNCTDKTINIVKKFSQKLPLKIIKEKKQGMTYARNCGFNDAQYEILARCDADTILPLDWIKKIDNNFKKEKIDALTGPIYFYDLPFKNIPYTNFLLDVYKLIRRGEESLIGPNMAITKKIWLKIKNKVCLDNQKIHEDIDLSIHIYKEGGRVKRDPTLLVAASGRRIKYNPLSFFVEYPIRLYKTLALH
ncbi:MAG: glycosyltransferase family A protein [Microgenomates group bacterium]|nr:glycosyltransferase family A protein [Microgenomates group bacterium]